MYAEIFLYLSLFILITGVLSPFFINSNRKLNYVAHGAAALGCLAAVLCAIFIFVSGTIDVLTPLIMFGEAIHIRLDYLAAYFLLIIGGVGAVTSVYAVGYSREYVENGRRYQVMASLYSAFLLAMVLVIASSHVAAFLVVWELMAVTSFFLVNYEHHYSEVRQASFVYMVMTHVGTAFIMTAFFLLAYKAGSMDFAHLVQATNHLDHGIKNIVFLCALIGFGTKAGIIPLHIWLPRAHPAAPSHVSALMSGVMLKTAIYGLCRFYFNFLGTGPAWWGVVLLVLAIVSAILGVLYALMESDVKRLLAYSSAENVGIILLGMGAGMVFAAKGMQALAALGWAAALYHVLNHAVFKSLLFMGAGAVLTAAKTKELERLGGLIKQMPFTAVCFLVGTAAISALPPLNGFVSEWLTFQSLLYLPQALQGVWGKVFGALLLALLGLTGGLAAACFVKAFGIAFLGKPRSIQAQAAPEVNKLMLVSMAALAGLCVFLGLWPQLIIEALKQVLANTSSVNALQAFADTAWYTAGIRSVGGNASLQMSVVIMVMISGVAIAWAIYRLYGKPQIHNGETWTCGIVPTARMEYTATGFSKPIRMAFRTILRPQRETVVDVSPNRYFGRRLSYYVRITDIFAVLYRPMNQAIIKAAQWMKGIQAGSVQLYIGYITAITVLALIVSNGW